MPDNDIFFSSPKLPTILNKENFEKKNNKKLKSNKTKKETMKLMCKCYMMKLILGKYLKKLNFTLDVQIKTIFDVFKPEPEQGKLRFY